MRIGDSRDTHSEQSGHETQWQKYRGQDVQIISNAIQAVRHPGVDLILQQLGSFTTFFQAFEVAQNMTPGRFESLIFFVANRQCVIGSYECQVDCAT